MYRQDREACAAPLHDGRYDEDRDHQAWDVPERPRKGFFRRLFSVVKFAVFALPLAMFLYGSFADCGSRPAPASWLGLIGAGACARNEIVGSAFSMQDNFAALKRLID